MFISSSAVLSSSHPECRAPVIHSSVRVRGPRHDSYKGEQKEALQSVARTLYIGLMEGISFEGGGGKKRVWHGARRREKKKTEVYVGHTYSCLRFMRQLGPEEEEGWLSIVGEIVTRYCD